MAAQEVRELPEETHGAHGGRLSLHGYSYQLKLLMLSIVRGLGNNLRFQVTTEMKEAGKFDDVVITQSIGNCEIFRLLQAKHSAGDSKGLITARSLVFGSKGDFCLPMYFQSYLMIQGFSRFRGENKVIKDLILYTNRDFKYNDRFCEFELRESIFEKEKLEDGVDKVDEYFRTVFLRFKKKFKGRSFLVSHLKNAFVQIPKSFAESVVKGKAFNLEINCPGRIASKIYSDVLLKEVIDPKAQSFLPSFIEGVNLSPEARHFRDVLMSESFDKHHGDESVFKTEMMSLQVNVIGMVKQGRIKIDSPAKVAETLSRLMRKGWDRKVVEVTDPRNVIARNIKALTESVFARNMDGEIRFSPEFISGNNLVGNISEFHKLFVNELKKRDLDFTSINQFQFKIVNFEETPTLLNLPSDEIVEAFLEKLAFAVKQPSETKLDDLIMENLLKEFNAGEAKNVHARFLRKTFKWMTDIKGKEWSHEDCRIFFQNLKKEMLASVRFRVKHPSVKFTVEEHKLTALHEAFKEDSSNKPAAFMSQSVVITGTAGVGKTELARTYIYRYSGEYVNLIWINAGSNYTMGDSFRKLAFDKLGIRKENVNGNSKSLYDIVSEVYDFLRGKSSLFVFDDAKMLENRTKSDPGLRTFLPKYPYESKHFSLITSRGQTWVGMKKIHLETFGEKDSVALIKETINLESSTQISEAEDLAKALQFNPLALQQAISCIEVNKEKSDTYTISDYLQSLKEISGDSLDFPLEIRSSDSYTKSTYRAWDITMSDIKADVRGKLAVEILDVISYFASDDISLENIAALFPVEDSSSLLSTLMFLKRYYMISIEQVNVSIHKLVQRFTRLKLQEERKEEVMLKRLLDVAEILDPEHSIAIWDYSIKYNSLIEKFSYLPSSIIQKLTDNYKLGEAYHFSEQTVKLLEEKLGKRHESSINVREKMAIVTSQMGHYEEALAMFEEIHEDRLLTQEEDHPEILRVKHHIAKVLSSIGRYEEALKTYEDVLSVRRMQFGKDHIETLSVENNIANTLYRLGDYQKALSSYEKVYENMKVSIGEDHEKALTTKLNLANTLEKLGQLEKALNYYQEIYEISIVSSNRNLHMILDVLVKIASILEKLGKYRDSLDAYQQVCKELTDIYGEDHPKTLDARYNICNVLLKLQECDRAMKSCQEVEKAFSKICGENHKNTLKCNLLEAQILYKVGFHSKALQQYQDISEKLLKLKGDSHSNILLTNKHTVENLIKLEELDKPQQIYREDCEKMRRQFGENDTKTISSKQNLANLLFHLGKYKEAYEVNSEIYHMMNEKYGELNEDTLIAKLNVGCALYKLGKHHESVVFLEEVLRKLMEVLGKDHHLTKSTEEYLKTVLFKVQNHKSENILDHKCVRDSKNIANDLESVEEGAENFVDSQSEHNSKPHGCHCVCLIHCQQSGFTETEKVETSESEGRSFSNMDLSLELEKGFKEVERNLGDSIDKIHKKLEESNKLIEKQGKKLKQCYEVIEALRNENLLLKTQIVENRNSLEDLQCDM